MSIQIISVGQKAPKISKSTVAPWHLLAILDYQQRLQHYADLTLTDLVLAHGHHQNSAEAKKAESEKILSAIKPSSFVVALDERGKSFPSQQLAKYLSRWQMHYKNITFLIGGPAGLETACLEKADMIWSLSPLIFPHRLVKVILLEQLYRAFSLNHHHPYHRE